ncbi:phosphate ABC transporter permease PstA [Maridesulfovibrio bastinii]|uniref:phosphate ABC transporter permease PstA n=1 Tax=Maridesulfovibrio bastinii TaxID=47157 RepID=UPI00146FA071
MNQTGEAEVMTGNNVPGKQDSSLRFIIQKVFFWLFRSAAVINGLALLVICGFVLYYGLPSLSWEFLTEAPRNSMTEGGIFPCILGTIILSYGALLVALPWGVATAIYLNEYATSAKMVRIIRLGINNLAGVPSVVFGLFGLSLFVTVMGMGVSILAGVFTLGALALPLVIGASEEALRSVPQTYREASLGLGATKWQTIYKVVLPAALPGMLTGSILTLSRAAGETAAIMFTAAVFYTPEMPKSIFDDVMALPYHIYVLATAGTEIEKTRHIQYGTSLVLITLVLGMNLIAIYLRAKMQKRTAR